MTAFDAGPIDELLQAAVDSGAFPGLVAVVTARDGLLYQGAAGRLSIDGDEPVTADTVFRLASATKAIATVGLLTLVDRGQVDLDATVASYVPEFAELAVLDGFDGDQPRLRPPAAEPTVRQLLSHCSGLGYFFLSPELLRWHEVTGTPTILDAGGPLAGIRTPLVDDPGARWEYGVNVDWAGQIVERVSGQGLDAYLDEHVLGPLGMGDTSFTLDDAQRSRLMALHARTPDGGLALSPFDLPVDPEYWAGGHGLYATGRDYARFMAMLLGEGELDGVRVLQAETVQAAFTDQLAGAPLPEVMRSTVPELANDVPALPVNQGWGLGFHLVLEDLHGMRRAGTGDWAGLFNLYYWIDRASGVAAMIMTQMLPFFDADVVATVVEFEQAVYAQVAEPAAAA